MTSDFSALSSAALDAIYRDDLLPTRVLADFLADRGDERERRLRVRLKRHEWWVDDIARSLKACELCADLTLAQRTRWAEDEKHKLWKKRVAFISYFIRLMATPPGERVPREKLGAGYGIVEPQSL